MVCTFFYRFICSVIMLRTRIGASVIVNSSEMEQSINNNPRETSPEKTQQNLKTSLYAHHRISNTFTTR